jgi:hypothetical protein
VAVSKTGIERAIITKPRSSRQADHEHVELGTVLAIIPRATFMNIEYRYHGGRELYGKYEYLPGKYDDVSMRAGNGTRKEE